MQTASDAGVDDHLEIYVAEVGRLNNERDMRGLYKDLKVFSRHWWDAIGWIAINQGYGRCSVEKPKGEIVQRWEGLFDGLLNTKSPKRQPKIIEEVRRRPGAALPED